VRGRVLVVHDPHRLILRRALRVAVVVPIVFALVGFGLDRTSMATFAAFGSFAMLGLTDLGGPLWRRAAGYAGITVAGGALIAVGTAASRNVLAAAVTMAVVGFGVTMISVFGGYLAQSGTALTLAFVLAVTIRADTVAVGERLAGWAIAGAASIFAATLLWPTREHRVLSAHAGDVCRSLAALLRATAAGAGTSELDAAYTDARAAADRLRHELRTTPFRPAGPTRHDGAFLYLVDGLSWLTELCRPRPGAAIPAGGLELLSVTADALDSCADALHGGAPPDPGPLVAARDSELDDLCREVGADLDAGRPPEQVVELAHREFTPRVVSHLALSVVDATLALRRQHEAGATHSAMFSASTGSSVTSRVVSTVGAHLRPDSVLFRNALRIGLGLGVAIGVAVAGDLPHAFWVGLGTLTALRSNALGTGFTVLQAMAGTLLGFVAGGVLVSIGSNRPLLWVALPVATFLAAYAPSALGFVVGQASFTVFVVVLFSLLQPSGWKTGEARVVDIAIGCTISLLVGLIFWPRGAAAQLRTASTAYVVAGSEALVRSVGWLLSDDAPPPAVARTTPARLRAQQALTVYLGERGTKPTLSDHARALVSAGRAVDLSATAIATIAGTRHGVRGCPDAVAAVERSAEAVAERVVSAASRLDLPPAVDAEPAVLGCFQTLDDHGRARVHAALRLIWAEAWLQSIDDLAVHLSAQDDARPGALAYASR
jgi:uncharacterized membrane protein YccC